MRTWDPELCSKAWHFATLAHQGQVYGGPTEDVAIEYINHVGCVAMEVMWALPITPNYDPDLAVQCSLLHDVIEDTDHTYEEIHSHFGRAVADGVMALSKNAELPTREERVRDSLHRITQQPREIWLVKMADRIANLRYPPHHWEANKIRVYSDESLAIYHQLRDANVMLANRLIARIHDYRQFYEVP